MTKIRHIYDVNVKVQTRITVPIRNTIILGLDSQFAIIETVLSGILDFAPKLRPKKTIVVGIVCTIGFICGLPLTSRV